MDKVPDWSDLPGDLLHCIAKSLFSEIELLRFRGICKTWCSTVETTKQYGELHNYKRRRVLASYNNERCTLFPAAFYRVILSSSPDKGWLIKTQDIYGDSFRKQLLSPLSGISIHSLSETLDLIEFTVSEIHQSYDVMYQLRFDIISSSFARVVLVNDLVIGVTYQNQVWWCNSRETNEPWARIMDEEVEHFSDIVIHKGYIYALDLKGAIWWISLSDVSIFQYGPSTPLEYNEIDVYIKGKRLVEYCGDLCVVHRFSKRFLVKRVDVEMTIGFKVYKMNEEIVEWVEVKSLGDKAFVMARDRCFTVLAREYYGCLENSIYFVDEGDRHKVKVFMLGDGSITKMSDPSSQSWFQMFSPPFV